MFIAGDLIVAVAKILDIVLEFYKWIVIIAAVISWVSPDPYNPIVRFLRTVTEPALRPIRRLIGYRLGPIDISPFDSNPCYYIYAVISDKVFNKTWL